MQNQKNSQAAGLIVLMCIITAVVAYYSLRTGPSAPLPPLDLQEAPAATQQPTNAISAPAQLAAVQEVVVHVAGAVMRPDVYHLPSGARVNDAIRAAGGATAYADMNALNLAAPVQDGARIYVPRANETPPPEESAQAVRQPAQPPVYAASGTAAPASIDGSQAGAAPIRSAGKIRDASQGTVNINTASLEDLQRLPGIGPAIAQRIVEYRQSNGGFRSPDELKNVSGIGDKKFEKLAGFVSVN